MVHVSRAEQKSYLQKKKSKILTVLLAGHVDN